MTTTHAARAAAALSLLLLIAGCADTGGAGGDGGGGTGTADATAYPAPDDAPVLRVEHVGGFVRPTDLLTRLPVISVYGDGRVIEPGARILSYPPAALPSLQERRITAAGVGKLVDKARTAGVGGPKIDYGQPGIADAASTRFTLATEAGTEVVEVYALQEAQAGQGLTAEQARARKALRDLLEALTNLPATLGADAAGEQRPYRPTSLIALSTRWSVDPDLPGQQQREWPGPALPGPALKGQPAGTSTGCVDVTGTDARKVMEAAAKATEITPWLSGGKRWTVSLRPLLPDEDGCASVRPESSPSPR